MSMFKICEGIQTRFVQFRDQKKTAKKVFLTSQQLKICNINTGHKFRMV